MKVRQRMGFDLYYLEMSLHSIACGIPVVQPTRTQRNHHSYER